MINIIDCVLNKPHMKDTLKSKGFDAGYLDGISKRELLKIYWEHIDASDNQKK